MAAPTCVVISFMVLVSLEICSAQPVGVHTIKAKEAHHHNLKGHTLTNIHTKGFGGGGGFGFGGGGGGGGGGSGFGIGIGGGRGGDGSNTPSSGCNQPGCDDPGYNVPGYGSPIYIPGFGVPVYSPGCGCVCPANNPSGVITELKISGLSHSTGPYRCTPGPNMRVNKNYNHELLLHFVSTIQDKHESKQEHLRHGGHDGDVGLHVGGSRRFGFGRGSGSREAGGSGASEYDIEDPGCSIDGCGDPGYGSNPDFDCPPGCGYVCPGTNPSGGITEFHISGLSQFIGPYRCRPDMWESEDSNEFLLHFVSPMHDKHQNHYDHPVERSIEEEAGHWSEQHKEEDIIN